MEYVDFVHGLSDIRKGLVEFKDASHWLIRSQNPGDHWRIQYACFPHGDYARGKDDEIICQNLGFSYDLCACRLYHQISMGSKTSPRRF